MSYSPRPCSHCGGVNFHVLPGIQLDAKQSCLVFGMRGSKVLRTSGSEWWTFTMVVCAQCGHTDAFSTNTAEIAQQVAGAYVATSAGR